VATHHRTAAGLEAVAAPAAFAADVGVRKALVRNPELPASLLQRLFGGRRVIEQFKLVVSHEVSEQTRRTAGELPPADRREDGGAALRAALHLAAPRAEHGALDGVPAHGDRAPLEAGDRAPLARVEDGRPASPERAAPEEPESTQCGNVLANLGGEVRGDDPLRLRARASRAHGAVGRDDEVDPEVVLGLGKLAADELQGVDGGRDPRPVVDAAQFPAERVFQIRIRRPCPRGRRWQRRRPNPRRSDKRDFPTAGMSGYGTSRCPRAKGA
jgi:hypothetical protein